MFVALGTQHAIHMRHIVICGLSGSTIFFHNISHTARFSKKSCWIQNVCFDFLYSLSLKHFPFYEELSEIWSKMYIGLHVQYYPLIVSDFNGTEFSRQSFETYAKIKFHENLSSVSRVAPCGQMDRHDKTNSRFSPVPVAARSKA